MFLCGMRSPRSRPSSARPICDTRQLSLAGLGSERGAQDARLHQTLPDALRDLSPLSLGAVSRPAQCVARRSALTRTPSPTAAARCRLSPDLCGFLVGIGGGG